MCLEDKKLGMRSTNRFWTTGATADIPADARRTSITLAVAAGEVGILQVVGQNVNGATPPTTMVLGRVPGDNVGTYTFRIEDFGLVLQGALRIASAAGADVFATETLLIDPNFKVN